MTKQRPLSYQILQTREDGFPKTVARVGCSRCTATLEVKIVSGDNHLSLVERHARQAGWLFNKNVARKCVCPGCYWGPSAHPDPVSGDLAAYSDAAPPPLPVTDLILASHPVTNATAPATTLGTALVEAMKEKTMINKSQLPAVVSDKPRSPTPADKLKIRQFLDGNYDERLKGYLESGMTDEKGAKELGVPMAWVRDLRELAYGPIECDGELMEVRQALDKLMREVVALNDKVKKLEIARRS